LTHKLKNQDDIPLVKGIHSNRGSWLDRSRFWANQTWSSTLQSSLKQDFFLKDTSLVTFTLKEKADMPFIDI